MLISAVHVKRFCGFSAFVVRLAKHLKLVDFVLVGSHLLIPAPGIPGWSRFWCCSTEAWHLAGTVCLHTWEWLILPDWKLRYAGALLSVITLRYALAVFAISTDTHIHFASRYVWRSDVFLCQNAGIVDSSHTLSPCWWYPCGFLTVVTVESSN